MALGGIEPSGCHWRVANTIAARTPTITTVRSEVEAAGFTLASTSDVLRNPADTRDWRASPMAAGARRGTSDRFILVFVKPG